VEQGSSVVRAHLWILRVGCLNPAADPAFGSVGVARPIYPELSASPRPRWASNGVRTGTR